MPETIVGVALQMPASCRWVLISAPKPYRHSDLFYGASRMDMDPATKHAAVQGFVTSCGRFVNRAEAAAIALAAGQIVAAKEELFSEDLW